MVAFLRAHSDDRLTSSEEARLAAMIRRSDNAAASEIRNLVGESAIVRLAQRAGMKDFHYSSSWGLCRSSARDQAAFMHDLDGLIPTRHRAFAHSLLRHVVGSQRWGIAKAPTPGWTLDFKGGWGISDGSHGGTVNHQVALLQRHGARIGVAILTQGNPSQGYGTATLEGIADRLLAGLPRSIRR